MKNLYMWGGRKGVREGGKKSSKLKTSSKLGRRFAILLQIKSQYPSYAKSSYKSIRENMNHDTGNEQSM